MRTQLTVLIGFLAATLAAGSAWAGGPIRPAAGQRRRPARKSISKIPIASAFRLPSGTTLNAKQEKAYEKLKTKYESTLREALDLLHSKDKADQSKGLKLNRETRAQIRLGIKDILAMPYADAQKAASGQQQRLP